jgi:cytochrome c oxidase cbb3-type subunit 3
LSRPVHFYRRLGALALLGLAWLPRLAGDAASSGNPHDAGNEPAPAPALHPSGPANLAAGERLFQVNCAGCHGPHGEGSRGPTLAQPHLPRAANEAAIVKIIAQGIHGTEMPPFKLEATDDRNIAAWVWHLGQLPPEIVRGHPARGEVLYRTRGNCALCHFLPQTFAMFREDANITTNFLLVSLTTSDGTAWTGVRVNEDTFSIQIRDLANGLHSFLKSELTELHKEWGRSPMPSYAQAFTRDELDDLVAFLAAHKG